MIQTSSLRRGNWLNYTGESAGWHPVGYIQVSEILEDGVNLSDGDQVIYEAELLEGIPLTPDILKLCGHTKYVRKETDPWNDSYSDWDAVKSFKDGLLEGYEMWLGGINLGLKDGKYYLIHTGACYDESTGLYNTYGAYIQYLHQLQNLHHALTGKELEVKLPQRA